MKCIGGTMYLTGYHGTSKKNGYDIVKSKHFNISISSTEWLGSGIYFYCEFSDALKWSSDNMVLHAVIYVEEDEYIDLDSENGLMIYDSVIKMLSAKFSYLVEGVI
jgi:hypothetical protein